MVYKEIMKYCTILLFLFILSCGQNETDKLIFAETGDYVCDQYFFKIDGMYRSYWTELSAVDELDGYFITANNISNKKSLKLDVATSVPEQRAYQFAINNNVRINNNLWYIDLYFPEEYYGTYKFEISDNELEILRVIISLIERNIEGTYFPEKNKVGYLWPAIALYLKIGSGEIEYFASLESEPCEFQLLAAFIITVINHHVVPEQKKDNRIKLNDIRKRFDYYVMKDDYTGVILEW